MHKIATVLLALTISIMPMNESASWYREWMDTLITLNIRTPHPTYKADEVIKRIDLLSWVMTYLHYDLAVSDGYWGQSIIDKASELNIISSHSSDRIYNDPEGYITREEAARVVYNAYLKHNEAVNSDHHEVVGGMILDLDEVGGLFKEGVVGCVLAGIVEGYSDHSFKPKQTLTHAEAAVLVSRLAKSDLRLTVELDLNTFTTNEFQVTYGPEHQDIYNIMTILQVIEDKGYVHIIKGENHQAVLYSNQEDFMYASDLNLYKRWIVNLKKTEPLEQEGWIELISLRHADQLQHQTALKAVFNYLFAEDADRLWDNYFEYVSLHIDEDETIEYESESFGRNIKILARSGQVKMMVSRKENALPVLVEDHNVVLQFVSTLSDGGESVVKMLDATDESSKD